MPSDADARLILAYFRWFEGDVDTAHEALAIALFLASRSSNAEQIEAVNTFWKGLVASGKVAGELIPQSPPLTAGQAPLQQSQSRPGKPSGVLTP